MSDIDYGPHPHWPSRLVCPDCKQPMTSSHGCETPGGVEYTNMRGEIAYLHEQIAAVKRELQEEEHAGADRVDALNAKLAAAEREIASLHRFKASVDEALNTGDGSYRP